MNDTLTDLIEQLAAVDAFPAPAPAPAKPKRYNGGKPRKGTTTDWTAVFAWVQAAKADGTYSLRTLQSHFGTQAKNWKVQCAKRGMTLDDTPEPTPTPVPTAAPSPVVATIVDHLVSGTGNKPMIAKRPHVLACTEDDCGAEFATDKGHELYRHCLDDHGRRPYNYERTPVVAAGPVAGAA